MSDGANLGIDAKRALGTVIGGQDQPTEDEKQTPEQVRARIASAEPTTYEGTADTMARVVLRFYEERPESKQWPVEKSGAYYWKSSGLKLTLEERQALYRDQIEHDKTEWKVDDGPSLFDEAKESTEPGSIEREAFEGCTGFQWGFAANLARWLSELPPAQNPAIIDIGG